jgi:Lrp/AsnC family transcriptional regulator, leucine-responsive regulatory protein
VDSVRSNIVLATFKRNGPLPLSHLADDAGDSAGLSKST